VKESARERERTSGCFCVVQITTHQKINMDAVILKERRTAENPSSSARGSLESTQSILSEGKGNSSSFMMISNKNKSINEGLVIWERQRKAWRNLPSPNKGGENTKKVSSAFSITKRKRGQSSAIPPDATYEDLLLIPFVKFAKPIKLGEMIDFLVETWSEENNFW
jgi:hypothetical protein